ncbi:MAG: DMT family transporter [Pseudomonadota bacterium]
MQVLLLYATVVLIWGSTFAAIPYQLGTVPIEVSVAYRFGLSAIVLALYAKLSGRSLRIPREVLPMVVVQALLMFCLNYFLVYYASAYITTGLIAVLFTTIVLMNAVLERLLFNTRMDRTFYTAAGMGVIGIALVFWPEISALSLNDSAVIGILFALGSVLSASLGNMAATVNMQKEVPVVALNAYAMGIATLMSAGSAMLLGRTFTISLEATYIGSLLYLSVFGSAVAFGAYLALIRRIGPSRASYCTVLFPIVALALSTVLENYVWTPIAAAGILVTLLGNWLILSRRK